VRRLDVGAERIGLRALAERLGERQEQREYRDQQRDALVAALGMMFDVLRRLVRGLVGFRHDPLPCSRHAFIKRGEKARGYAHPRYARGCAALYALMTCEESTAV